MVAYRVSEPLDIYQARREVQVLAARLGFAPTVGHELALVVSELCTNILKYGIRGSIDLRSIRDPAHGVGIEVVARDEGPPFHDFALALLDGHDDQGPVDASTLMARGGLASGLGAVRRLTDVLLVEPESAGKRVIARRFRTAGRL